MNEEKKRAGRPPEFKEEYIDKAEEYLSLKFDEYKDGKQIVKLPTIEGFAVFIGVHKSSLYEWEKKNLRFSNALNKIRTEQQERLINKGLSNDYNSTIAKLILSSNHGMRERTDVTSDDERIERTEVKEEVDKILNDK